VNEDHVLKDDHQQPQRGRDRRNDKQLPAVRRILGRLSVGWDVDFLLPGER
jgi:hypothetical protein